jgi:hypothetical protein
MKDVNPIELVDELRTVLRRYIATALPISRRYPKLAERFREELAREQLVVGPYVEALPDFEKGPTLEGLLNKNGGYLHDAFGKLPTVTRRLHRHQERALEISIKNKESLLVATGTGSGKTETFLYPIAHELLSESEPDKPGVRALLVYPMNALANDQLYYRVAPLFARYLAEHGVTFGRYTGQIKANVTRGEEEARLLSNQKLMEALDYPNEIPRNWLLTREEMLRDPPKVLITNYAMLEHLLLLPRNEALFSANALRFLALDEIHTYHGAQATEVAFLLRKLKNRLRIDNPLQVFGTSASLADGPQADEQLKAFATSLFGETVQHVVRGKRVAHSALHEKTTQAFSLSTQEWIQLGEVLHSLIALQEADRSVEAWNGLLEEAGLARAPLLATAGQRLHAFLERTFSANREVRALAELLELHGARDFEELARLVFNSPADTSSNSDRYSALSAVIRSGMVARADENGFPLLPGRYHIAVNSIEGVAVLPAADSEGWAVIKSARHHRTSEGLYYPLLTCRKCGQPYVEGYEDSGYLHNRRPDASEGKAERRVFWLGTPVGHVDDEEDSAAEAAPAEYVRYWLNVKTGQLGATEGAVPLFAIQTVQDDEEKAWYVRKCPACGGRATGVDAEIVTRMHPGNEALGSVVTQRVLEALPGAITDYGDPKPAQGRTLLSFSDNRQDAAFFAPYFERTAADLALRSAIRNVLKTRETPITGPQLADQIYQHWQRDGRQAVLIDGNGDMVTDRLDVANLLLGAIGMEFCAPGGRRNSLEALGVVSATYDEARLRPLRAKVRAFWPSSLPSDDGSLDSMVHILLEHVRRERALAKFHNVPMLDAFIWGDYNQHRTFDIEAGDDSVRYKWLSSSPQSRPNRRSWYLIEQLGLSVDAAQDFLRRFWEALVRPPVSLLVRYQPGFGLDGDTIRFKNGDALPLYVCKSCGLMQRHTVADKCTAFRCRGEVEKFSDAERKKLQAANHYLSVYEETEHVPVRAREHTASLSTDLREQIEREFAERRLNLLSCTTTMEMGVDLGDLEAVVNLNVPPGIANYQQRTGRAGRRAQAAPFCVTVARNTNYDQAVVRNFPSYLASSPNTPFIHLDNAELFRRHQQSVMLSHFLRHKITDRSINAPSLKHVFGVTFDQAAVRGFTDDMYLWLDSGTGKLALQEAEALVNKLPDALRNIGSQGIYLRNRFLTALREFAEEVSERYNKYSQKMEEFKVANELGKAAYWQRMRDDFMNQFLVDQLSRRGLIPTYSFPVHSLTLEVIRESTRTYQSPSEVALVRDATLGISEYAPGAEVVANGRIWESAGLAQYPKAFMPERWYVACSECFHVDIGDTLEEVPGACGNCGCSDGRRKRRFVEPHGFVTSYKERRGRDPGSNRRRVKAADEARLIAAPRDDVFTETGLPFLRTALLSAKESETTGLRGTLFIANRGVYGEGYHRCSLCNYAEPIKRVAPTPKAAGKASAAANNRSLVHDDPLTGLRCKNDRMSRIGLDFVHRFDTDVRLFRFLNPLPHATDAAEKTRRFHERIARTVAEAMRLAAIELLQLHSGEVRAIYRLYGTAGSTLEVVLYDGVPGGAGYCARLGEAGYSFAQLFDLARKRLTCDANCESACRVCLCDYGNQRHWDSFDRKPALAWIESLLDTTRTNVGPGHYVPWPAPTVEGLTDRLSSYDTICLVGRSLIESGAPSDAALNQLINWMQAGKTLHIYLANKLLDRPRSQGPLSAYRHLHPYVQNGQLRLYAIPATASTGTTELPRVFVGAELGTPIIRQHFAFQPILESLIETPSDIGIVDEPIYETLRSLLTSSVPYPREVLQEGARMKMVELQKGKARDIAGVFAEISGSHVKDVVVRDPYCGARVHRPKLQSFLQALKQLSRNIEHVSVICREHKDRNGDVEFYLDVEREVDTLIKNIGIENRDVSVSQLKGASRAFHDREVDIVAVTDDGCDITHRYFLTGGVDYLMDKNCDTRVFYVRLEN